MPMIAVIMWQNWQADKLRRAEQNGRDAFPRNIYYFKWVTLKLPLPQLYWKGFVKQDNQNYALSF